MKRSYLPIQLPTFKRNMRWMKLLWWSARKGGNRVEIEFVKIFGKDKLEAVFNVILLTLTDSPQAPQTEPLIADAAVIVILGFSLKNVSYANQIPIKCYRQRCPNVYVGALVPEISPTLLMKLNGDNKIKRIVLHLHRALCICKHMQISHNDLIKTTLMLIVQSGIEGGSTWGN